MFTVFHLIVQKENIFYEEAFSRLKERGVPLKYNVHEGISFVSNSIFPLLALASVSLNQLNQMYQLPLKFTFSSLFTVDFLFNSYKI